MYSAAIDPAPDKVGFALLRDGEVVTSVNCAMKGRAASALSKFVLDELAKALAEKNLTLHYTTEAAQWIAQRSYSRKFGARNMRRFIQTHVEDPLAEKIIADVQHTITQISLTEQENGDSLKITCL